MRAALWRFVLTLAAISYVRAATATGQLCAECHAAIVARFRTTPMANALTSAADDEIFQRLAGLTFRDTGYETRITRNGDRLQLTVAGQGETLTVPLLWAFGRGQAGQTYVFARDGALFESRVSFYNSLRGLDLTMGAQPGKPKNIEDAAGRLMSSRDAADCFGCHSSGAVRDGRLNLESMSPGVACESCHGPAPRHMAAIRNGDASAAKMPKLASSTAEEMSELCGRCHRTWSQIAANGPRGVLNVRFQPYRLTNSRCYDVSDARIRCTACHDPHGPLETAASAYDARCSACHTANAAAKGSARTCRVAKQNCVTCHMPKVELPGAHARFTDHQIRIARAGEPYPN
jgi:Cytochrome c554 and c-prime